MEEKESPLDKFHNDPAMRNIVVESKDSPELRRVLNVAVGKSRRELASSFAIGDITQMEALELIKQREDDFIEYANAQIESGDNLPKWFLRKQAQHTLAERLLEGLEDPEEHKETWD